ncbi:MAG: N-6 DNA methylase [Candidatus Kapaibacterium sp.]
MLLNALEKAERIKSNSFITWNGKEAIIWKIAAENYSIKGITRLKKYHKEKNINRREDLANPNKFRQNEPALRKRLSDILHDLEQLYLSGELKQAINISGNFVEAVKVAAEIILPQFKEEIKKLKGADAAFRKDFNQWKIYESSTLKILASSSRRPENVIEEEVLAKFTFYNLIGKIIFYLTLSENLSGRLQKLELKNAKNAKQALHSYFEAASRIDYQAVYKPYFTDKVDFNNIVNETLFKLFKAITEYDFKVLPTDVIGTILENLVPKEEKQKFGQYFTPSTLANLVAFPSIQTASDFVFDPTSGTGSILNSFYQILNYHGNTNHSQLLNQIWGNDISHFPAILSVINLYKQRIKNQTDNFPRVMRDDYFNLEPKMKIFFPDSNDYQKLFQLTFPIFDAIASNFPFIQQEDIPNEMLTALFREEFEDKQKAFLKDNTFRINKRSDYFTYCIYNSIRFLKKEGLLSAITSNAWLGKEYGFEFKKFLLDNFYIKYIVRSNAEHWFNDSKVSTIFSVLKHGQSNEPTKFVTVNFKLEEAFDQNNISNQLKQIEQFYIDIDSCSDRRNKNWKVDTSFENVFHHVSGTIRVSEVMKKKLIDSLTAQENWDTYFISSQLFEKIEKKLIEIHPNVIEVFRGERTGWNPMFVIPFAEVNNSRIEKKFLVPYVKRPSEIDNIRFSGNFNNYLFVCDLPETELNRNYPGAYNWINRFLEVRNTNGTKTIPEACNGNDPYWYSLRPKKAHIITAINPYERFFFSYSETPFTIDQRLVAITVDNNYDVELIAALLNSIVTFLTMEMRGTSRNLGALDLNANYFKKLRVLNPAFLTLKSIKKIKKAFQPLKARAIKTIFEEVEQTDRKNFDRMVLNAYGIDDSILNSLYKILISSVSDRVTMKEK